MERVILALNCGSSSLKFGLYRSAEGGPLLVREGEAEEIGGEHSSIPDHATALAHALAIVSRTNDVTAVGHRIVHGGPDVRTHQILTPRVAEKLRAAVPFAPLHLPAALSVMEAAERKLPKARQVICLDTAFHREMPEVAENSRAPGGGAPVGDRAIRVSWPVAGIDRGADESPARTARCSASRERSKHHGNTQRPICRYEHGVNAGGRHHDGHAQRRHRSR